MPWLFLRQLFDAFADIRGVGVSKMTKTLHPKRPALIPLLDSVVQTHLRDDDLGPAAEFGERALALVRGYKGDLDRNSAAVAAVRRELAARGRDVAGNRGQDRRRCVRPADPVRATAAVAPTSAQQAPLELAPRIRGLLERLARER